MNQGQFSTPFLLYFYERLSMLTFDAPSVLRAVRWPAQWTKMAIGLTPCTSLTMPLRFPVVIAITSRTMVVIAAAMLPLMAMVLMTYQSLQKLHQAIHRPASSSPASRTLLVASRTVTWHRRRSRGYPTGRTKFVLSLSWQIKRKEHAEEADLLWRHPPAAAAAAGAAAAGTAPT
jgi:hypothetical protein